MTDAKTIFAPATAVGKAGVSVFRLSGKAAAQAVQKLCAPAPLPAPRHAALRALHNPQSNEVIDRALVIFFPAPNSFTGEDVVELHTHGGRAVSAAIIHALSALPELRLAEPGEFTRRAFENGKMDLTEAEALADLVHAETEAQRKQALRQMDGALGRLYETWRAQLSHALAYIEAAIDFSDEELPEGMIEEQKAGLTALRNEITAHLNDNHRGERLRDGFSIAILGAPNAGKSSLLNALTRREAAIVSPTAGTTRDVIETHLDIGGFPVVVADTAGLHDASNDSIENEGMRRAHLRAEQADLKLIVVDASAPLLADSIRKLIDADTLVVLNKADLPAAHHEIPHGAGHIAVSALTGTGVEALVDRLAKEIEKRFGDTGAPPLTRTRHRASLTECVEHLSRALKAPTVDMFAEDVRLSMRALGRITGRVDVEDLLDIIFRDFCLGK